MGLILPYLETVNKLSQLKMPTINIQIDTAVRGCIINTYVGKTTPIKKSKIRDHDQGSYLEALFLDP